MAEQLRSIRTNRTDPLRQFHFLTALVMAALAIGVAAYVMVYRTAFNELAAVERADLSLARQSLASEIERFRNLPRVLRHDERIRLLVDEPASAARVDLVNRFLATIRDQTNADELFVLDAQGLTIAASNHDSTLTFVGQNYRFRPYFVDAMEAGSGQFYAIGATTGRPGYFLSSRLDGGGKAGVVVVKVDMSTFARSWRENAPGTALMDRDGVVFLAGDPDWLYRPFAPLTDEARARIEASRKYTGVGLEGAAPIASLKAFGQATDVGYPAHDGAMISLIPVNENGWRLVRRTPLASVKRAALTGGVMAGAATLLLAGGLVIMRQRRSIVRMKLDQNARLEAKVAERTAELAQEIEERKRAETDLRDAQESLIQSAKLAALGHMSAAIAHEVSQPLAAMDMTLATAGVHARANDPGKLIVSLDHARETVRRMQRMVKHLKVFAKRDPGALSDVDLRACVMAAVSLAEPRRKAAGAIISVIGGDAEFVVRAGQVRLEQVFLNILINALDAVDGLPVREVTVDFGQAAGAIQVAVADTGAGIAPADLPRVSEPFFTTKQTGEGLGLGLSISGSIIENFKGSLSVHNRDDGGTVVTVELPAADRDAQMSVRPARRKVPA
jgi:two-component system C4-dicarboxylate transport sensor histidine kinase DctB